MSTKILNAYKIVTDCDPWQVVWAIQDNARAAVRAQLREAYWNLMCHVDLKSEPYLKALAERGVDHQARLEVVRHIIHTNYVKSQGSSHRNEFDLDVSIVVTPYDGVLYFRTFCEKISLVGKTFEFLKEMPEVVDFHYQNSTDKPANISAEEWEHRSSTWDAVEDPNTGVIRHATVDVCSRESFYFADVWLDIAREHRDNPPTFPSTEELATTRLKGKGFTDTEFGPGHIKAVKYDVIYEIIEGGNCWYVKVNDGELQPFDTLTLALERVSYLGLPEEDRRFIDRILARSGQGQA